MTHDEMIAVIQAHKDGKEIEWTRKGSTVWKRIPYQPSWDFCAGDYRVKPEPMVRYIIVGVTGNNWSGSFETNEDNVFAKMELEKANRYGMRKPYRIVKFVEEITE